MFEDVVRTMEQMEARLESLSAPLNLDGKRLEIADLEGQASENGFWDDPAAAQTKMQRLNALKESLAPWLAVRKRLDDAGTLAELASLEENPEAYTPEIESETRDISDALDKLEIETLLSGPHDDSPGILEINAGAGGTDANDWASMLQRMYLRWADRHGFKAEVLDEVGGDVAGIKSTVLRITGKNIYGLLQGERGVHRLVRISPFNSGGTRETSFAGVDITPEMADVEGVEIADKDLHIDYYRASGAGGQHVNKTSSAVRIKHIPTGLVTSCQNERSQGQNKAFAMNVLKAKLLELARLENKAGIDELRGERRGIEFGSQIRNYFFQPETRVTDDRSGHKTGDILRVMNGEIDDFIDAFLRWQHAQKEQGMNTNALWLGLTVGCLATLGLATVAAPLASPSKNTVQVKTALDGAGSGRQETNLGDLVADAVRQTGQADIALLPADEISELSIPAGDVPVSRILAALHYAEDSSDTVVVLDLTGAQVRKAIERSVSRAPQTFNGFLQVSGLQIRYDASAPEGKRVNLVARDGTTLADGTSYKVAVTRPIADGGLGYFQIWDKKNIAENTSQSVAQSVTSWLGSHHTINNTVEGRIASGR